MASTTRKSQSSCPIFCGFQPTWQSLSEPYCTDFCNPSLQISLPGVHQTTIPPLSRGALYAIIIRLKQLIMTLLEEITALVNSSKDLPEDLKKKILEQLESGSEEKLNELKDLLEKFTQEELKITEAKITILTQYFGLKRGEEKEKRDAAEAESHSQEEAEAEKLLSNL